MPPDSRNNRREAAQTGNDRSRTGYVRALHEHTRKSSSGSCYGPQARKIDAGAALMYFEQAETRFDIPGIDAALVCLEHGIAHRQVVWIFGACGSEEHTSELQSLMRISYAVLWLKKK